MRTATRSHRVGRALRAAAAIGLALAAGAPLRAAGITLDQALAAAERRAPLLAARRAAVEAAGAAQHAAGELPDPALAVGVENVPVSGPGRFTLGREPATMQRLAWMQEVPNRARRAAQREAAAARLERERSEAAVAGAVVRRETALAWYGLYYAQQRLEAFAQLERENRLLRDTLAARVVAGNAMPADDAMARQESLALADRRDELERDRLRQRAALSGWVGPLPPDGEAAGPAPVWPLEPARRQGAAPSFVELAPFAPAVSMAGAAVKEAEAMRRGDWSWEVAYGRTGAAYADMVSFQLRFQLPVAADRRQEPEIAARRRELDRIAAERDEAARRLGEAFEAMRAELQVVERARARLDGEALGLARERVALALAAYAAGRGGLEAVIAARRELAELRLRALDLQAGEQALRVRLATQLAD